ncbi:MAG TPA: hypothetical protein PKD86_05900 [Gemmatales bacterium]|nr:hypothetical protein [Gemmatales bacterium]HMP58867.1 hypothetical protein [Gemmatales bacterium]
MTRLRLVWVAATLGIVSVVWWFHAWSGVDGRAALDRQEQREHEDTPAPRLRLPACRVLDAGAGSLGQVLEALLPIENTGKLPLEVDTGTGRACAYIKPPRAVVAPGATLNMAIGIRLRQEGKSEQVLVRLTSNDPRQREAEIMVMAKCPAWLQVEPAQVALGTLPANSHRELELLVTDGDGTPLSTTAGLDVLASSPLLQAEWISASRLRVLVGPVPKGVRREHVTLRNQDLGRSVQVPVSLEGVGWINVAPRHVALRHADEKTRAAWLLVSSNSGDMPELDVEVVPPLVELVLAGPQAPRRRRFQVQFKEPAPAEPTSVVIHLRVRGTAEVETVAVDIRP